MLQGCNEACFVNKSLRVELWFRNFEYHILFSEGACCKSVGENNDNNVVSVARLRSVGLYQEKRRGW